jgi:hypothetical protein
MVDHRQGRYRISAVSGVRSEERGGRHTGTVYLLRTSYSASLLLRTDNRQLTTLMASRRKSAPSASSHKDILLQSSLD